MKQVQKITQIQHHLQFSFRILNGDQNQIYSSLSNRLIPSHSFKRKLLKNKLDRKQIHSMKNFKNKKMLKKTLLFSTATGIAFLACKTLKFGFLFFCKHCIELNFLSKNNNLESIGILSRKLEPKYETGAKDNTSSASSLTSFQNSNGDQHQICSSLSKQVYLLPQLQKKANNLTIKLIHPFPI